MDLVVANEYSDPYQASIYLLLFSSDLCILRKDVGAELDKYVSCSSDRV
jgi:hypothetical protein